MGLTLHLDIQSSLWMLKHIHEMIVNLMTVTGLKFKESLETFYRPNPLFHGWKKVGDFSKERK